MKAAAINEVKPSPFFTPGCKPWPLSCKLKDNQVSEATGCVCVHMYASVHTGIACVHTEVTHVCMYVYVCVQRSHLCACVCIRHTCAHVCTCMYMEVTPVPMCVGVGPFIGVIHAPLVLPAPGNVHICCHHCREQVKS